ncbi:MAG: hypothetical protein Q4D74_04600 [Comamonadaceae bacterium]|nr:hypothetical protein [Comamonadaceae bacterium]
MTGPLFRWLCSGCFVFDSYQALMVLPEGRFFHQSPGGADLQAAGGNGLIAPFAEGE